MCIRDRDHCRQEEERDLTASLPNRERQDRSRERDRERGIGGGGDEMEFSQAREPSLARPVSGRELAELARAALGALPDKASAGFAATQRRASGGL